MNNKMLSKKEKIRSWLQDKPVGDHIHRIAQTTLGPFFNGMGNVVKKATVKPGPGQVFAGIIKALVDWIRECQNKFCTPAGIIEMLDFYKIDIEGKNAVILGRSNIVGKPMASLLLKRNATVTICHSRTQDLADVARSADILVAAIGKAKFVTEDMVGEGATVIDVGINRVDGKLVGDVDFDAVAEKAAYITPVPGGVGPMTIAMLLYNTVESARKTL